MDQIPKLLGIHIIKAGFFRDALAIIEQLPSTSVATLAVAVAMLVLIFALERFAPRAPAPLLALGLAIGASAAFNLSQSGVATIGAVSGSLPSLIRPQLELAWLLWPAATGIALMSFTESIAAARAFAAPGEPRPAPNRELRALGCANLAGGLLGSMPAGGGTTQTAVNRQVGARTQVAELVTGAMTSTSKGRAAPTVNVAAEVSAA